MVPSLRQWGPPVALSVGVAGGLALAFGAVALVNYDTLYGLLWGRALFEGGAPDLAASPAPTQHPLLTAAGFFLAPLWPSCSQRCLEALVRSRGAVASPPRCTPLAVPNRRAVPYLALWTGAPASSFVVAQEQGVPSDGVYLLPSSPAVAGDFILDRRDLHRSVPPPAPGMARRAGNAAWTVWGTC